VIGFERRRVEGDKYTVTGTTGTAPELPELVTGTETVMDAFYLTRRVAKAMLV
jgi:hypothetical protein